MLARGSSSLFPLVPFLLRMLLLGRTVRVLTMVLSIRFYVFVEKWVLIWKLYVCWKGEGKGYIVI